MNERTLIAAQALREMLDRGEPCVLLDCGFDLADPQAGARAYAQGHLPSAHYADLDRDLSAARTGTNGRHPLPSREVFAQTAARWGLRPGVAAVCYDDQGSTYAARAWWMLRWLGHRAAAVLDGGRSAWRDSGGVLSQAVPPDVSGPPYALAPSSGMPTIDAGSLLASLGRDMVLDARAGERFRGEVEPLDPVAGHIPGARNRFFRNNLGSDGRFLSADSLRAAFDAFGVEPGQVVHLCGSGVTACHNLLAMEHAGLAGSRLYPGSWSEWCADPARPVAQG
jgi:thiosulfate/3-mercaptopyruvate sulfurtransferase